MAHQTAEALKILVEDWDAVRTSFVSFDLWRNQYSSMKMTKAKDESCFSCGTHPNLSIFGTRKFNEINCPCGRDTVQVRPPKELDIQLDELSNR